MQTGRHQRADGVARQGWTPRRAAQRRRPDDLRPRRRRDRRLPRCRNRGRCRAGRDRGTSSGEPAEGIVNPSGASAPRAIHHRSWPRRRTAGRYRLGKLGRSSGDDDRLHAGQNAAGFSCQSLRSRPRSGHARGRRCAGNTRGRAHDRRQYRRPAGIAGCGRAIGAGRGDDRAEYLPIVWRIVPARCRTHHSNAPRDSAGP